MSLSLIRAATVTPIAAPSLAWRKVLGEYPEHRALDGQRLVFIEPRCELLDGVAMGQEQRLPGALVGAPGADQFVHRGVADPAFDRIFPVQHHKSERQAFVI